MKKAQERSAVRALLLLAGLMILGYLVLFKLPHKQSSSFPGKSFILLSFDDFDNLMGLRDPVPPAHQQALFDQYRGRYVRWHGEVWEVGRDVTGDILLKVRHNIDTEDFDVLVRLNPSTEEEWGRLSRGKAVSYIGRLVSFSPATGYYLDKGEIE